MKMKLMTKYSIHVILVSSFFSLTNGILNRLFEVPDRCENEIVGIESFYERFFARYHSSPVFFIGSLHDVCEEGINSHNIEEVRSSSSHFHTRFLIFQRRPILIYIHFDKAIFSNIFCSKLFCSEVIIDYLMNNYLVWPWDITLDSIIEKCKSSTMKRFTIEYLHENRLKRKWKERIFVEQVKLLPMKHYLEN